MNIPKTIPTLQETDDDKEEPKELPVSTTITVSVRLLEEVDIAVTVLLLEDSACKAA